MKQIGFNVAENILQDSKSSISKELIVPANFTHSCAIGQTGCGKTTSYIYPNIEHRIKENHAILVVDYKGKEHAVIKLLANKYNRLEDVIELGVSYGPKVNALKYMSEAELKMSCIALSGLERNNDLFWAESSATIIIAIYKALKQILCVLDSARDISKQIDEFSWIAEDLQYVIEHYALPQKISFNSLAALTSSHLEIITFSKSISSVREKFKDAIESIVYKITKTQSFISLKNDEIRNVLQPLAENLIHLDTILQESIRELNIFAENSNLTTNSILITINMALAKLSSVKEFNEDELDVVQELNNGKILIINVHAIQGDALSYYFTSILKEISKRISEKNIRPLSCFIDEAQRVMSPTMDLHEDILREAKCELFLAFQNVQLMIKALGENKFYMLYQNLAHTYHFKNNLNYYDLKVNKLKQFEFLLQNNQQIHCAKAIFLEDKELFDVQRKFLKMNKIYKLLHIEKFSKYIIVHNSILTKSNQLLLQDKAGESVIVPFAENEIRNKASQLIDNAIEEIKEGTLKIRRPNSLMKTYEEDAILNLFKKKD